MDENIYIIAREMGKKKRAQVLIEALTIIQNYLHWREDDLVGDDLIGDKKFTASFEEKLSIVSKVLAKYQKGDE